MDFQEILHQQFLSNSLENYCWFLGFVLFGLLFKRIISKYLSHIMYRVLNRDKSIDIKTFDELLIKPIGFFVLLMFIYLGSLNIAFPQELNFETKNFIQHLNKHYNKISITKMIFRGLFVFTAYFKIGK